MKREAGQSRRGGQSQSGGGFHLHVWRRWPPEQCVGQRGYTRNPEPEGGIGGIIALKNNTVTRTYAALALLPGEQVNEEDLKVAEPQAVKAVSPYYYFYDGQGSVGSFTGSSGADIGAYGYDAFGRDIDHSGVPGRWLTPDPIGMADGLNKYLYVHNNPVNLVDPEGLCGEKLAEFLDGFNNSVTLGLWGQLGLDESINQSDQSRVFLVKDFFIR